MHEPNGTRSRPVVCAGVCLSLILWVAPAAAQGQGSTTVEPSVALVEQHKEQFVAALKELVKATEGRFGDEGDKVWRSIDAMQRALAQGDEAIRELERAIASKPEDPAGHVALGRALLDRQRIGDALPEFAAAIRIESRHVEAHAFGGVAYREAGRLAEAADAFRKASQFDSEDPTLLYDLAQVQLKLGRLEEAKQTLVGFHSLGQKMLAREPRVAARMRPSIPPFAVVKRSAEWLQGGPVFGAVFAPARYEGAFALLRQGRYVESIAALRTAASADPLSANAFARRGKITEELEATEQALQTAPSDAQRHYQLGTIRLALSQRQEARQAFERALELDPDHTGARVELARLALRAGAVDAAMGDLSRMIQRDGDLLEAKRLLGMAYWADGQYEKSAEQLQLALGLRPDDERIRFALAAVLISAQRFGEGEMALQAAIEAAPSSGLAHYSLGRLHHTRGRWQEALRSFERAAELQPVAGSYGLHRRIGRIYSMQAKLDEAIEAYRRAIEVNPNAAEAHMELGELYFKRNRHDEALAELTAALLINPQSAEAYSAIGQVHLRAGRYAEAAQAAEWALQAHSYHSQARYTLGQALLRLGKADEGRKELERFQQMQAEAQAREHRDRELAALRQEAAASVEKGDHHKAVALLRKAVEYEPNVGIPHLNLGVALIKAGRREEAIQSLNRALELKIDSAEIHRHLADAYKALGRLEESEKEKATYVRMKQEQLRRMGQSY